MQRRCCCLEQDRLALLDRGQFRRGLCGKCTCNGKNSRIARGTGFFSHSFSLVDTALFSKQGCKQIVSTENEGLWTGTPGDECVGKALQVSVRFTSSREWIEVGSKLLLMPSGMHSPSSGAATKGKEDDVRLLEGFVGKVVRILQ